MTATIDGLLAEIDQTRRAVHGGSGTQIQSNSELIKLQTLCATYFASRAQLGETADAASADDVFRRLLAAARGKPSRSKVSSFLTTAKKLLVKVEGELLKSAASKSAGRKTATDQLIIETLEEICPTAAEAYSQALLDLSAEKRLSWRGPATDLREALRETLDVLAPDGDVEKEPGFKLEKDAHRPTMKQKVRHILKKREATSGAMATPESAVEGIEDIVGGLTRSVYTRSSVSTHTATDKGEVIRVHAWVRLIFCDLLEVPPE